MARSRTPILIAAVLGLAAVALAHGTHKNAADSVWKAAGVGQGQETSSMKQFFAMLFPFENPAWNAILGTFYISSIPNFILLAVPETLEPSSLNTMIAFATGGLLGDVFLHLVPHAFFGEHSDSDSAVHSAGHVDTIVVEPKRNIVIGGAIFLGFAAFFVLDKTMRVVSNAAGDEEGGHAHAHGLSHGHSHGHSHGQAAQDKASSTSVGSTTATAEPKGELRLRKSPSDILDTPSSAPAAGSGGNTDSGVNPSLKLSAYLNLFGDFTHNITDGLAMAASFYSSPALGAVTTIATFCHEIPHEIADYSILIKSGFTKTQAMKSQFGTAVGAFVGTFLGIWIAETSGTGKSEGLKVGEGFFGTSVGGGELVIPMTAGGFLYIASVSVVPELLAESKSAKQAIKEYVAMAFGVFCMAVIAWNE